MQPRPPSAEPPPSSASLSRRDVLRSGAVLAGAAALPAAGESPADVYRRAISLDALTNDSTRLEPKEVLDAGLTAAIVDMEMYPRNFPNAQEALAGWTAYFEKEKARVLRVTRAADLQAAKAQGKLAIVLACQDAQILDAALYSVTDDNIKNLEAFYKQGLRVLQLTHNDRNGLGDSYRERSNAGLSILGERVVTRMNELGMLVDLSHCGDRTTAEAIALSKKPCAITHAGCRAVYATGRNKPDELLRALAERGGVFGVFNMSLWLTDKDTASVDTVLDHVDHAVKVAGVEHVGFGGDGRVVRNTVKPEEALKGMRHFVERNKGLPGAERVPMHVFVAALDGPDRLLRLAEGLGRRGYKAADIEKIIGGNFVRLLRDTIG